MLAAVAITLREKELSALLSLVESCLWNSNSQTMERPEVEVFKVWPTFRDRETFKLAMQAKSLDELRERFPLSFRQGGSLRNTNKKTNLERVSHVVKVYQSQEILDGKTFATG